jgi:thioredoxin reductase
MKHASAANLTTIQFPVQLRRETFPAPPTLATMMKKQQQKQFITPAQSQKFVGRKGVTHASLQRARAINKFFTD